ncbi:MAG: hypothetical protein AB7J35_14830 [Dehalococcoidia bacterium]
MHAKLRIVLSAVALSTAAFGIACDSNGDSPPAVPPTEVVVIPTSTPVAEPTVAVPPTETPEVEPPAATPVAIELPTVLWMSSSHAGPGVVTIRFETNVPTKATVMAMTNQVGPASFYSEDLDQFETAHFTSVPASAFGRYKARVEDNLGNIAWAELRYKSDPAGIDWATGGAAPMLVAPNAKELDVTYAFPAGHPTKLGLEGSVHVFTTDPSCTTAMACVGEPVGPVLDSPAAGNAELETHKVIASIPGSGFDYQVIAGQPLNEAASTMVFIQLEIRGSELPKTKVSGPGTIKAN